MRDMGSGMVRVFILAISFVACSAVVWVAMHKEVTHSALMSARRLLGEESGSVKTVSFTSKLRGSAEIRHQSSEHGIKTAASTQPDNLYYDARGTNEASATQLDNVYYEARGNNGPSVIVPESQYESYREYQAAKQEAAAKRKKARQTFWTQLLYGVLFYLLVASKYPHLQYPNAESAAIMNQPTGCRCIPGPIGCQSMICPGTMLAHLLRATSDSNYCVNLLLGLFCPCFTVFLTTEVLQTGPKLGGPWKPCCVNAIEAAFCSCCVIAQANEALDAATGMQQEWCIATPKGGQVEPIAVGRVVGSVYEPLN